MTDQLASLRRQLAERQATRPPQPEESPLAGRGARVIAIASGKGGVGKTNVVVNLASVLARHGKRVLILDADLGLANVDVMLGIAPPYTLWHAIYGQLPLSEVIYHRGPLQVLAGASGVEDLADLPPSQREVLLKRLSYLQEEYDFLIIDCGAGVDHNVLGFTCAADEVLLISTPEPTAVMDVYGLIKLIRKRDASPNLRLVMNMVDRPEEGRTAADSIRDVALRFLGVEIPNVHYIPRDGIVSQSVRKQTPFVEAAPRSHAARAIYQLASALSGEVPARSHAQMDFFQRVGKILLHKGSDESRPTGTG